MPNRLKMGDAEYRGLAHMAGSLEFFAPFKGNDLDLLLSHIQLYDYAQGETIFKPGEQARALFIIYRGKVQITLKRTWLRFFRRPVRLEPGNLFGEMALLEERTHSAHAVTATPSQLFVLLKPDFQVLLDRKSV